MQECCEIYSLTYSWDQRHECATYCLMEDISECCYDQCFANTYKFWDDTTKIVNFKNIALAISRNNTIEPELQSIVDGSFKQCSTEIKEVPPKKFEKEHCEMSETMYWMAACILKYNYINCPNVTEFEECKAFVQNVECFGKPDTTTVRTTKVKKSKTTKVKKTKKPK